MKSASILTTLLFALTATTASASEGFFHPECDPMEVIENKSECVPPVYENEDEARDSDQSSHSDSGDTFEDLEQK